MIEELIKAIPLSLYDRSGKVFYSGRLGFSSPASLYVLGINPGGDPAQLSDETIAAHTHEVLTRKPSDWSAYRDEAWKENRPGTYGMQPRVLHLFANLGLSPGRVPSSNLVFVRSRREKTIDGDMHELAERCWPFHAKVVDLIGPKAILCFGKTVGNFVKRKFGATRLCDEFVEDNRRKWRSTVFENGDGLKIIVATHPSIADWTSSRTDPSDLVQRAIDDWGNGRSPTTVL